MKKQGRNSQDQIRKEEKRKKKKRENSTELQKPNVKAEIFNNNKKCD